MESSKSEQAAVALCDITAFQQKLQELEAKVARLESTESKLDRRDKDSTSAKESKGDNNANKKYPAHYVRLITNKVDPNSPSKERKDFESDEKVEKPSQKPDLKQNQGAAAILRLYVSGASVRNVIDKVQEDYSILEIFSNELHDMLKKHLSHYATHLFHEEVARMRSPFEPFVYNWDLLEREAAQEPQNTKDGIARKALGMVLDRLRSNSGDPKLDGYLLDREALIASKSITFDSLWTIFPPGTLIYGRPFLGKDQVFIVESNITPWPFMDRRTDELKWYLKCWTYDWDGHNFRRRPVVLNFPTFVGWKPIAALPFYPLSHTENPEDIKYRLRDRGKAYRRYCTAEPGENRYRYEGAAMVHNTGLRPRAKRASTHSTHLLRQVLGMSSEYLDDLDMIAEEPMAKSDVMVDFESFYQYGLEQSYIGDIIIGRQSKECLCYHCTGNEILDDLYCRRFDKATGDAQDKWDDLQYILCPPRVLGYILQDKRWAQLDLEKIKPAKDDADAFENKLHLKGAPDSSLEDHEIKKLLMDLVKTHGQGQVRDFVEDKGKGLVILLYGMPGTGKTSTAQTIAAAAKKPLFSIGVADMGTAARDVESNLKRIFDLATRWKAVLLIDEVDVFVQSRAMGHQGPTTERNALVSVFLRVLEYYQGILILTTNQIALFDVAVQSRIHVAIQYTELSKEQSVAIFLEFLDQYRKQNWIEEYDAIKTYVSTDLHKKKFDGRQLRNIVTSAMGIAQAQPSRRMTLENVRMVVSNMESFKTNLNYQMRSYQESQTGRPSY